MKKLFLLTFLFSCGVFARIAPEVIVDDLDWVPVSELSPDSAVTKNAESVGSVFVLNKNLRCSGWVFGAGQVMTNNHCVNLETGEIEYTGFSDTKGNWQDVVFNTGNKNYDCDKVVKTSYVLDYTVLECDDLRLPALEVGESVWKGEREVYVLHVNCDYYTEPRCQEVKLFSPGVAVSGYKLYHTADTLPGSSGSPLLDVETDLVVGLHHAGLPVSKKNAAVRLDKILEHFNNN